MSTMQVNVRAADEAEIGRQASIWYGAGHEAHAHESLVTKGLSQNIHKGVARVMPRGVDFLDRSRTHGGGSRC